MTALLVACLQGNAADADFLLEFGADHDSRRIFQARSDEIFLIRSIDDKEYQTTNKM